MNVSPAPSIVGGFLVPPGTVNTTGPGLSHYSSSFPDAFTINESGNHTFQAYPTSGYEFSHWTFSVEAGNQYDNPHTLNVTCNVSIVAYFNPVSIRGTLWNDTDGDGIRDGGETGRAGLTVELRKSADNSFVSSAVTDANGAYIFLPSPAAGTYYIQFPKTPGWLYSPKDQGGDDSVDSDADPATARTDAISFNATASKTADAGARALSGGLTADGAKTLVATQSGLVTIDVRDNGAFCAGHAPCAVNRPWNGTSLDHSGISAAAQVLVTGADGFDATLAANYLIQQGFSHVSYMAAPWSSWTGGSYTCAAAYPVADPGQDKAVTEDTLVTLNGSGSTQDAIASYSWAQVSGPAVTLSGADTLSPSFTTPRVDAPVNLVFRLTVTALCGASAVKDVTITVTDVGFTARAKGFVWNDADHDGIQDAGEQGLSGITVNLYHSPEGTLVNSTVTDANGFYSMPVPSAGDYYAEFVLPSGRIISPVDQGGNDAIDSDADPDTGRTAAVSFSEDGVDHALDCGSWLYGSILSPADALALTLSRPSPLVIDLRDNTAFCAGHIYCAENLSWPAGLKAGAGALDPSQTVLLVDADGSLAAKAAAWLSSQGFADVRAMSGGMAAWTGGAATCAGSYPAATAGDDQTVDEGALAHLSGAGSSTQGIWAVSWVQTAGPAVTLSGADTLSPSFTAPLVTGNQVLTFKLTVEAACGPTATDTVNVNVTDVGFSGTVSGIVWNDINTNGIREQGEAGIDGVTVKVYDSSCDCLAGSVTTAGGGLYHVTVTKAGSWYAVFTPPKSYVFTLKDQGSDATDSDADRGTFRTDAAALSTDGGNLALDAGFYLFPGNVTPAQAKAMVETNRNLLVLDVRESATEFCAAGGHIACAVNYPWTSGYLAAHYADLDPASEILVTCAMGPRSTQAVNFLLAKGFSHLYNMVPGMNDWISAGYPTVTCAAAFPAADAGPDQTVDEASIVTLDGSLSSTAGFAAYTWTQVSGPAVTLSDAHAAKPTFTAPLVTGDQDLVFSITVSAKCGGSASDEVRVTDHDIGYTVAVSGIAWDDLNKNGVREQGEPGLNGVTVKLYDASCDCSVAQTTTAGGGLYQMSVPAPGSYYARFTPALGYLFSAKDAGGNDSVDSDADPALGKTDPADLTPDGVNKTWDAGMSAFAGNVTPAAAKALLETRPGLRILDVRENATEFCVAGGHIYCAMNYPWTSGYLMAHYNELDPSAEMLVTCAVGGRSTQAVNFLAAHGFTKLYNMVPGMNDWISAGYPVAVCGAAFPVSDAGNDGIMEEGRTASVGGAATSRMGSFLSYAWTQTAGPAVALSDPEGPTATFVAPKVAGPTVLSFILSTSAPCGYTSSDAVSVTVGDNGLADALFPGADVTMKTFDNAGGLGFHAVAGTLVALAPVDPATITATTGRPATLPYGLVNLTMTVAPGGAAQYVIILPSAAPAGASWYKYGRSGWKDLAASGAAVFDATRTRITVTITDGGADDADGAVNGRVVDPSGLGAPASDGGSSSSSKKSADSGGGGCFVSAVGIDPGSAASPGLILAALALLLAGAILLSRRARIPRGTKEETP